MSKTGYYIGGHSIFRSKRKPKIRAKPPHPLDRLAELRQREDAAAYDPTEPPRLIRAGDHIPRNKHLKKTVRALGLDAPALSSPLDEEVHSDTSESGPRSR